MYSGLGSWPGISTDNDDNDLVRNTKIHSFGSESPKSARTHEHRIKVVHCAIQNMKAQNQEKEKKPGISGHR
jgi:hypothetical protein